MRSPWTLSLSLTFILTMGTIPLGAQTSMSMTTKTEAMKDEISNVSLLRQTLLKDDVTNIEIIAAAQADYARIVARLYEDGYFSSTVSITLNGREVADLIPFEDLGQITNATISVDEGDIFTFGKTAIGPLPSNAQPEPRFAKGKVASTIVIQDVVDHAIDDWRSQSHPKATVSGQQLIADHADKTLDAEFTIAPGPKATFGALSVSGHTRMREGRIRKIAAIPKGEDFDPLEMDEAARRLRASGVFSTVTFSEGAEILPNGELPIDLVVRESKPRRFGGGVTLSTNDGASVEGFWLHRNLLGGGERFRITGSAAGIGGETGGVDYKLGIDLTKPATLSPDTDSYLQFDYERDQEPTYTLRSYELEGGFNHIFSPQLEGSIGFAYRNADTVDIFGQRNFELVSMPIELIYDTRDSELSATKGIYLSFASSPFINTKSSEFGVRSTLDARAYQSLNNKDSLILAGRVQLGSVAGPDLSDLPADFLFYSGGGGSVRGQKYQSLGVEVAGFGSTGGRSFAGASGELRAPISEKVGAVVFGDIGYISEGSRFGTDGEYHSGVGVGMRFATGLGPIRLDIATATGQPTQFSDLLFYIGIGQAF